MPPLKGRLVLKEGGLRGPERFALCQCLRQFLLDPAALVAIDGIPQLGAQFLDVLIDRHWLSP
ncbi:conserved hypothetical protein [Agrobacterium deltaense NCPPB 1641]|uniref:Uncharacterized protein n=1 Tax=Agrobacterium deltaense NCPPB 1641 TaxID=1183425 RepID=A0A1S7U804_9HYPH|nr:conserved hypothetical protein [Agrobacterium deltaense NCPPB 1641]